MNSPERAPTGGPFSSSASKLDLYGGASFNGKVRIAGSNGNELGFDDFKTAPMMALSLTLQL